MRTWDQFVAEEQLDEGWLGDMWNSRLGMTPEQVKEMQAKKASQKAKKQMNTQIVAIVKKYQMANNQNDAYSQTVACAQEIQKGVPGSDYQAAMNQCATQIGLKIR